MCGISGIIERKNLPISKPQLVEMTNLVTHRGPDGCGYFLGENFGLGHRRLSIIDLTEAGAQPFHFNDDLVITYNGEVYNYRELRVELEGFGYQFKSSSDTEVILAAYHKWGEDCVQRFNGMWAFAIFDKRKNIIFCSRDRFGVKPFYYYSDSDQFVFGSEIKQLLSCLKTKEVNPSVLSDYLLIGLENHSDQTFFKGIHSLPPAHNLIYDLNSHRFTLSKYYEIKFHADIQSLKFEDAKQLFKREFERAVTWRLRSDVQVGTCLSGGLDSSTIAALASRQYKIESGNSFNAIHAKSGDPTNDESLFAKAVADQCPINLHFVQSDSENFHSLLPDVVKTQEEPFGSPSIILQYLVMQKSREIGCPVLLDGQGGDETLLGYERYYVAYLNSVSPFLRLKGMLNASKNSALSFQEVVQYFIYFNFPSVRKRRIQRKWKFISKEFLKTLNMEKLAALAKAFQSPKALQSQEICADQLPHLLRYEDKNSMRFSIETRLPFLDYQLLETSLSLAFSAKVHKGWTKYVLRSAMERDLTKDILWRKNKVGFEGPRNILTRNETHLMQHISTIKNSKLLAEILDPNKIELLEMAHRQPVQFWRLLNIAIWENTFNF